MAETVKRLVYGKGGFDSLAPRQGSTKKQTTNQTFNMAQYNNTTGAWLEINDELDGKKLKFVTECVQVLSDKFKNPDGTPQTGNLVKVRVQGAEESVNMRPNWTSIGALRDAFGGESKDWIGKILTVRVKDATTGQSAYLLPDGFELYRNEEKRWAIRKIGSEAEQPAAKEDVQSHPSEPAMQYPAEEINPEDSPF